MLAPPFPRGFFLALLLLGPSLPARVPPGTEVGRHPSSLPVRVDDISPDADLSDVIFYEGVDLSEVRFERVDLSGAVLKGVNLEQAVFVKGCWNRPVNFSGARLAKATFQKVDIHEADFRLADLTGADLSTSLVRQCQREGAIETGTRWRKPRPLAPAGAGDRPAWGPGAGAGSGPAQAAPDAPEGKAPRTTGKRKREEPASPAGPPLKKPRLTAWQSNLAKLIQYQAATGQSTVSRKDDPILSKWVLDQRSKYHKKTPCMTAERIAALEQVPTWDWQPGGQRDLRRAADWDANLAKLVQYQAAKGHTLVAKEDDPHLSRWVTDQRSYYLANASRLTPERIAALEKVPGWQWQQPPGGRKLDSAAWEANLAALKAYATLHKTTRIRSDHRVGNLALGRWVSDQRSLKHKKAASLTVEWIAALEAVPHWEWTQKPSERRTSRGQ